MFWSSFIEKCKSVSVVSHWSSVLCNFNSTIQLFMLLTHLYGMHFSIAVGWLCYEGCVSRWNRRILICSGFDPFHDFNFLIRMVFYCNRLKSLCSYFLFFSILGKSTKDKWNNVVIFTTPLLSIETTVALRHQEVIQLLASILTYTFGQFFLNLLLPLSCLKLTTIGIIFFLHDLIHLVNLIREILFHFSIERLSWNTVVIYLLGSWRSWMCSSGWILVLFEDLIANWNMYRFPILLFLPHLLHPCPRFIG